jgi:thiamine pyrophosphokinase
VNALIIANGVPPARPLARRLAAGADLIICADGGANHAVRLGIRPDVIVGDLDSVTAASRRRLRSVPALRIAEQESTDLEKAIRHALLHRCAGITVVGAFGGRVDHTAGNLGCFRKFGARCALRFVDDDGTLAAVRTREVLRTRRGELISLIPLGRCTGVTTRNFKYGLRNATLELGVREGTSNRATASTASVSVRKGTLLFYRRHRPAGR